MITFKTSAPASLLQEFKKRINQTERKGKIETWEEHDGGFRHAAKDWKNLGLFSVNVSEDGQYLEFRMTVVDNHYAYSYYHGHLLQAFAEHLNDRFTVSKYHDPRKK